MAVSADNTVKNTKCYKNATEQEGMRQCNIRDCAAIMKYFAFLEEELKKEVDEAVGNLVTPLKMKSHLITQLKTQIEDLEMFIDFLQGEASTISPGE